MTPYSTGTMSKKKKGKGGADLELGMEEDGEAYVESDDGDDDNIDNDTMIKVNTPYNKCTVDYFALVLVPPNRQ